MTQVLMKLKPQARTLVTPESWLAGLPEIAQQSEPFGRSIPLEPLIEIVRVAMRKFADDQVASDAWLAPRVHATLRLDRHEAADTGVWGWLTVGVPELREYVKWRWGKGEEQRVEIQPLLGGFNRQAFARLWWAAELARNGPNYEAVTSAFKPQNIADFLVLSNYSHNRAVAIGWVRFVSTANGGGPATDKQVPFIGKRLNHAATTIMLYDLALDTGPDLVAVDQWLKQDPDVTLIQEDLPVGPDEAPVPEQSIRAVEALLKRLWDESGLNQN